VCGTLFVRGLLPPDLAEAAEPDPEGLGLNTLRMAMYVLIARECNFESRAACCVFHADFCSDASFPCRQITTSRSWRRACCGSLRPCYAWQEPSSGSPVVSCGGACDRCFQPCFRSFHRHPRSNCFRLSGRGPSYMRATQTSESASSTRRMPTARPPLLLSSQRAWQMCCKVGSLSLIVLPMAGSRFTIRRTYARPTFNRRSLEL
jgi:hypothetical protein